MRINSKSLILIFFLIVLVGLTAYASLNTDKLNSFKTKVSGYKIKPKTMKAPPLIKPTTEPFYLKKHLSDIDIDNNQSFELLKLYPEEISLFKNIASGTYKQFNLGKNGKVYNLNIKWNSQIPLNIIIFDRFERPIAYLNGKKGQKSIDLYGSVYKTQLFYNGFLSKDTKILFDVKETNEASSKVVFGVKQDFEDIPKIKLGFSLNINKGMQFVRQIHIKRLVDKGANGNPIDTVNVKHLGTLYHSGVKSQVQAWSSGQAEIAHFQEGNPSFTVKIVSGPLFHGMKDFKLYTIKSKEGLLDYVVSNIFKNRGIFLPRLILADVTLDNGHAGLYIIEELPTANYFAANNYYDGLIQSMGNNYIKSNGFDKIPQSYNMDDLLDKVDINNYAKYLSLNTRFNTTHGLGSLNTRFFYNAFKNKYLPIARDLNTDLWSDVRTDLKIRSLLAHSSWWMGARAYSAGAHFNIKSPFHKPSNFQDISSYFYESDSNSIGLYSVDPFIIYFMNNSNNRELFEKYLSYYSSPCFKKEFLFKLARTFVSAQNYLKDKPEYLKKIELI